MIVEDRYPISRGSLPRSLLAGHEAVLGRCLARTRASALRTGGRRLAVLVLAISDRPDRTFADRVVPIAGFTAVFRRRSVPGALRREGSSQHGPDFCCARSLLT